MNYYFTVGVWSFLAGFYICYYTLYRVAKKNADEAQAQINWVGGRLSAMLEDIKKKEKEEAEQSLQE